MSSIKIISRKALEGTDRYDFCPFCYRELQKTKTDYKDILQPLWLVITAEHKEGMQRDLIRRHYECTRCGNKNITVEDFIKAYVD